MRRLPEAFVFNRIQVEIKNAKSDVYKKYSVIDNVTQETSFNIPLSEFAEGNNIVRLMNIGGYPSIDPSRLLFMTSDSEYIEYKINIDKDGTVSYVENDTTLKDGVYDLIY